MRAVHAVMMLCLVVMAGCFDAPGGPGGAHDAQASIPPNVDREGSAGSLPAQDDAAGPGDADDADEATRTPGRAGDATALPAGGDQRMSEALGVVGAAPVDFSTECAGCQLFTWELAQAAPADGWLDVRVGWNGTVTPEVEAVLHGPDGELMPERGFDAVRFKVPQAAAGDYVLALAGDGAIWGRVQVMAVSLPKSTDGQRLPNIVTMVPEQVAFGPCDQVERTEQGAQRCLRLGNAIGNVGDGPVEVHLTWTEAALALAGEVAEPAVDGIFVQRIYDRQGGTSDRAVGTSDFHQAHAHWHYDGFAVFGLYPVDPSTGLRGEVAAAGHKSGFCFLDWGPMQEEETPPESGGRAEQSCLVPWTEGWSMGVSAGYFDFYWAGLTDQYVEASGVGDGVYELVSRADHDDWLLESDESDNVASVLLRITGDEVEVLEGRGWYHIPADTSNL